MMTGKMGDRDSPEEIRRVFKLFDDDETGNISFDNLKRVAKELQEMFVNVLSAQQKRNADRLFDDDEKGKIPREDL